MAEFPAIPLWTDAYLADTTHLTTIEHGAYLLLLMAAWRSPGCKLPNDDKLLARFARLTPGQWRRIKPTIMPFFKPHPDGIHQPRLTDEHAFVRQHSKKQSDNARARWLKTNDTGNAMAMPDRCQTDAPTPTPTPTPIEEEGPKGPLSESKPELDLTSPENLDRRPPQIERQALDLWSAFAERVDLKPKNPRLDPDRAAKLKQRINEAGGIDGWNIALGKVEQSNFLMGGGNRSWRADFDFMLSPKNFRRLMEGGYDDNDRPTNGHEPHTERRRAGLRAGLDQHLATRGGDN